jgi:prophage regulatory protein
MSNTEDDKKHETKPKAKITYPRLEDLPRAGLLRREQFMGFIGVKSRVTLYRMIRRGDFPPGHALGGNLCLWRAEDIHMWIEEKFPRQDWLNRTIKH